MTVLRLRSSSRLNISPRRRSRATPFLPTNLPGLAFWYDGSLSDYADGIWQDVSGQDNHAVQPTPSRQPIKTVDEAGRSLLRFDGADDALLVDNPPNLSAGLTVFVVFRVRTPVNFRGIFSASAATGVDHEQFFTLEYEEADNRRIQLFGRSVQANQVVAKGVDSTEKQYAVATFDDDAVNVEFRDLNGIVDDVSTFAPFGTPAVMILGARAQEGTPFNFGAVDIYEIGLYNRALSLGEREQIEAYLQQRQGLAWSPYFIGTDLAWFHDVDASGFVLSAGAVEQWHDLSQNGRNWIAGGNGKPLKSTDLGGREVVRFDGVDDLLSLVGDLPALQPFSVGVVYRMRERGDFTGVLSAAPPAGTDHSDFWTFRNASAASLQMQLYGRSNEPDPLELSLADSGAFQVAVWSADGGGAELRDASGSAVDSYGGSLGAPDSIVLGGRYDGAPFGHAAIDVLATLGAARALSATDQQRLIAWAIAKWSL